MLEVFLINGDGKRTLWARFADTESGRRAAAKWMVRHADLGRVDCKAV